MTHKIPFTKMTGTGNDFLVVDATTHSLKSLQRSWPRLARQMCDRRYGVGADGVLVLERSRAATVKMRVFNPDGSEAEMCGNGARCVAAYVQRAQARRHPKSRHAAPVTIETKAGVLSASVVHDDVTMRMSDPSNLQLDLSVDVDHRRLQVGYVNTGVPHAVVPVTDLDRIDVEQLGRQLRFHRAFQPQGANVDFIESDARRPQRVRIRTYERGVEGETLACGTGVTAAAVIHALRHHGRQPHSPHAMRLEVETRSREILTVSLTLRPGGRDVPQVTEVMLQGAVRWICQGVFLWPTKERP